jgi:DNA-binding CsgD family transcriptional regulator/PAS domain-containing protein
MAQDAVVDTGPSDARARMRDLVRNSPVPLYLIRLSDTAILEVSDAVVAYIGRSRDELLQLRVLDEVQDADSAKRSFDLLASGAIDSFTRHGHFRRPNGDYQPVEARYTTCFEARGRAAAIGQIIESPMPDPVGLPEEDAPECTSFLGTVDSTWTIDRISSGVEDLLGPLEEPLGKSALTFVHPEDIAALLLLAAHAAGQSMGAAGRIRLRNAEGGWTACRLSLHELKGASPGSFAFAVASTVEPDSISLPRTQELEEHLRRIAREIAASGVAAMSTAMPTATEMPEISALSTREYEIVVRLAHGERVPHIARTLFLSESTVRNHLTSVYRKFGVGSQVELLDRLSRAKG